MFEGAIPPMDVLLVNGQIYTMEHENFVVQALAIQGDRIKAIGTTEEILTYRTPSTTVIDLQGKPSYQA